MNATRDMLSSNTSFISHLDACENKLYGHAMNTWLDLEERFKQIQEPLRHYRLDIQWGIEGEYFRLTGGSQNPNTRKFEVLAGVAGRMIERSLSEKAEPGASLLKEQNPQLRWYRALKDLSGEFQHDHPAQSMDEQGNFRGHILFGSLHSVAEASANLCLRMHAEYPLRDDRSFWARLYDDYGREIVIGSIVAVVTAIIGIFFG